MSEKKEKQAPETEKEDKSMSEKKEKQAPETEGEDKSMSEKKEKQAPEAEKEDKSMSKKKEKQAPEAEGEELVRVRLFKDSEKYSDDVFVAVNGERCLIQRGKPVEIKAKFAEVLEHSAEQDEQTAELIHKRSEDYRQAEKELN